MADVTETQEAKNWIHDVLAANALRDSEIDRPEYDSTNRRYHNLGSVYQVRIERKP